jgi:hypothetical protein
MTKVAGKVTFGSTGTKVVSIGIAANDIYFFPDGTAATGYADHSYQFSRTPGATTDRTKAVVAYDPATGTKVLELSVTAWGPTSFTCNVTVASASWPFDLVAST